MLVTHTDRPRELRWYHAGPMLYGDWGTSRFYVLGLAFFYAFHASFYYVLGVCALVAAVGWAYTIVCRSYPDGGGVYSAAKHTSPVLAVIGALLLFADYIITAAISAIEAMHYFDIPKSWAAIGAILAVFLIGIINYIGPRKAGTFALIVAMGTLALTLVLLVAAIPHLGAGWAAIHRPTEPLGHQWIMLVNVVLALSGVEAVANMTGIMVHPVKRTSKQTIIPVLIEVVILNLVFAVAMNSLPSLPGVHMDTQPAAVKQVELDKAEAVLRKLESHAKSNPEMASQVAAQKAVVEQTPHLTEDESEAKNAVLRLMGKHFIGTWFAAISGIVFGLLLLSAVNTAVSGMISIQYVMSRDTELPHFLRKLNIFGVPWLALLPAVLLPIVVLFFVTDLEKLADLYAIGVVGAITINLGSCTANKTLDLKKYERIGLGVLTVILLAIEVTLSYQKPHALFFASTVLGLGLLMRFCTKTYPKLPDLARAGVLTAASAALLLVSLLISFKVQGNAPMLVANFDLLHTEQDAIVFQLVLAGAMVLSSGSLASTAFQYLRKHRLKSVTVPIAAASPNLETAAPAVPEPISLVPEGELDMDRPHVMVATRGGKALIEFAATYAKDIRGIMFVLFVRQVQVSFTGSAKSMTIEEDQEAKQVFLMAKEISKKAGIQMIPIYVVSSDIAYSILDFAATYNVRALLMGVSRKGTLLRALQGDVITSVADNLPSDIPLLIHA